MVRTFLDSGVLLSAARSVSRDREQAEVRQPVAGFRDLDKIEATAQSEAAQSGLAAMDALHLAAAHLSHADEFITTERPEKPIYRSSLVKIVNPFK